MPPGSEAAFEQSKKTQRVFGTPKKARAGWQKSLALVRATPWPICHYQCLALIKNDSNLSVYGTFLIRLIPPPDIRVLLSTPKEIHNLNLSKVPLSIWSFRTPTTIFSIFLYQELV